MTCSHEALGYTRNHLLKRACFCPVISSLTSRLIMSISVCFICGKCRANLSQQTRSLSLSSSCFTVGFVSSVKVL